MMGECGNKKHDDYNDNETDASMYTTKMEKDHYQISYPQQLWRNMEIQNTIITMKTKNIPVWITWIRENKNSHI